MARIPFDPMNSAAMKAAQSRKPLATTNSGDPPLLSPQEERALIEQLAAAGLPLPPGLSAQPLPTPNTPPLTPQSAGSAKSPLTISQTNTLLSHALAASLPSTFFIQGEISNFRTYDRGHAFFTLKDPSAELPCILWKDALQRLKFKPKDGLSVIARGSVRLYEPQGKIQLYVETLLPQGAGSLELAFRQLCDKLRAEGLFEPGRKRTLPRLPRHIALITSRTGDVLHDVLTTAWRHFPGLHVSLYPTRVQGENAAEDIIRAIQNLHIYNTQLHAQASSPPPQLTHLTHLTYLTPPIDLILLVRGGGSLEDLWAFNEEPLARAIVASRIPIATGIGHEPDTTIADLVGDLRGPTPTGIAELTIPDSRALSADLAQRAALLTRDLRRTLTSSQNNLDRLALRLTAAGSDTIRTRHLTLEQLCKHVERIEPRHAIAQGWRRVEESQRRLAAACRLHLENARLRFTVASTQLHALSPTAILQRGYSITTDQHGTILRNPSQVQKGDLLKTQLAEGEITSTVGKPKQSSLF